MIEFIKKYRRIFFNIHTVILLALVYWKFSEIKLLQHFFAESSFPFLGAVIAVQLLQYLFNSLNYREILAMKGYKIPFWELYPIEFVIQFISQAIPTAHVSGQIFFVYYLRKYGIGVKEAIGRAILEVASLYIAYTTFFIACAVILMRRHVFAQTPELIVFVYGFLVFVAICILVFIMSQERRSENWIDWFLERTVKKLAKSKVMNLPGLRTLTNHSEHFVMIKDQFRATLSLHALRQNWKLFARACFWQELLLLCNVFTLWIISYALGAPMPFTVCFIAYTLSKFLSMISIIPGAPGVFEGAMTLILVTFGVPTGPALAAAVLTRAFTFWLPMPIGWFLYGRYMKKLAALDDKPAVS